MPEIKDLKPKPSRTVNDTTLNRAKVCPRFCSFPFPMAKRKVTLVTIDEDDVNDGSGSDDSREDYKPRTGVERLHHVPNEAISMGSSGRVRSTFTTAAVPASPSKKTRTILNPDFDPPAVDFSSLEEQVGSWEQDFSEFDAEYGVGLQPQGPRALRDSVSAPAHYHKIKSPMFCRIIPMKDGYASIARTFSTRSSALMVAANTSTSINVHRMDAMRQMSGIGAGTVCTHACTAQNVL
jgi:hypothetical protein